MRNEWSVQHRLLRDSLDTEYTVSIYYVQSDTDKKNTYRISIELYELDEQEVSREDLVDRFGEQEIRLFETDLGV